MRHILLLGLLLASPLHAQTSVDVSSEIAAAEAAAGSGDTAQARHLFEVALYKIDAGGYENTTAMEKLDSFRESVLVKELELAVSRSDVQWISQTGSRLRREHPSGRDWVVASLRLAEATGQDLAKAQALMEQESQADAAYKAADELRKNSPTLPMPQDVLQQIQATVAPYLDGSCASSLRCRWLLASLLIDSGDLEQGTEKLAALANTLLPAYGSTFNRAVRDRLFKSAVAAIEKTADQEKALALCKTLLAILEGGNEQNSVAQKEEQAVRLRLLAKEVSLASAVNDQAAMQGALTKLDSWFPTEARTLEAKRLAAQAQGQDSSTWVAQLAAEKQAQRALRPLFDDFSRWWTEFKDKKAPDQQSVLLGKEKCAASVRAAKQYRETGTAINYLVELGRRIRSNHDFTDEAIESLTEAKAELGKRTGWVAFRCWDALSEALLYRSDPACVPLCDATLASDPSILSKADAYLKKALFALTRGDPSRAVQETSAGVALLDGADPSVVRMIGWDAVVLLRSHLAVEQAAVLASTEPARAAAMLTPVLADLGQVSDDHSFWRTKLRRRASAMLEKLGQNGRP